MAKSITLINIVNLSFELKCLNLLIKSYCSAILENIVSKDWEEENISAHIVKHLRMFEHDFIVNYEVPLAEDAVYSAKKQVKSSNRIDIFFQENKWGNGKYLEYHVEAKNISSAEWKKPRGSKVNASQQQSEYITKGIDRFLTGHFEEKNGCMLGYLVNGELDEVLNKINNKIELQKSVNDIISFNEIEINNHKIFESIHPERTLKHLFFSFSNQ